MDANSDAVFHEIIVGTCFLQKRSNSQIILNNTLATKFVTKLGNAAKMKAATRSRQ